MRAARTAILLAPFTPCRWGRSLHPDVRKLLEVQKVDQKIAKIQRDLDSVPRERARREAGVEAVRRRWFELSESLKQSEVAARTNETTIRQSDEELKKLETRLGIMRNNAEYQATLLQMESVRKDRSRLEEEGLALLDQIEQMRVEVGGASEQLAEAERVLAEFVTESEPLLQQRRGDLERVSVGRDQLTHEIPPGLLDQYSRIFGARDSTAVCAVEGYTCTGCYTTIPPNLLVKLKAGSAVVICNSCQRILYAPD